MSQAFEQLNEYLEKAQALKTALVLFEWDDATLAPKEEEPILPGWWGFYPANI